MFSQNPYMMPYQQYYGQPMQDQLAQLRAQTPPQPPAAPGCGIIWVQGEEAAKAYMVAAGNSVMLMDSEADVFYIKSTDQSGMPLPLRVFDYAERCAQPAKSLPEKKSPEYATRAEFEALVERVNRFTGVPEPEVKADA